MRIYEEIVFDWNGNELSSKSFEYEGELTLCGGGGKGYSAPVSVPAPEKAQTKQIDASQTAARENQKQKALQAKGIKASILTEGGPSSQNSQSGAGGKTLLGQ